MIHKDCYFCFENRDMGACWYACNFNNTDFNEKTNPKFWALKDNDCDNCENYISGERLESLIMKKLGCSIREFAKQKGKSKCSICGSSEHGWAAHMNEVTKESGFGLWERTEGGFICGVCNKISPKPTHFCSSCGKWFTGVLAKTEEELFLNDH